jgi:uncharacterized membrane protein
MITPPAALVAFLKPWADFYGDSKAAVTLVTFLHIGGLLLAGGFAIAADRSTLRTLKLAAADRVGHLRELAAMHRWVLTGIAVIALSGVALVTADIEAVWASWIYWTKMGLVVLLLVNGFVMTRTEQALSRDPSETSPKWRTLHRVAVNSLMLWFAIAALGVALVNYS